MEKKTIYRSRLKKSAYKAVEKYRRACMLLSAVLVFSWIGFSGIGLAFSQTLATDIPCALISLCLSFPVCVPVAFGVTESFCEVAKGKKPSLGMTLSWLESRFLFKASMKFFFGFVIRLLLLWVAFFAVLSVAIISILRYVDIFQYFNLSGFDETVALMNIFFAAAITSAFASLMVSLRWFVAPFLIIESPNIKTSAAFRKSAKIMKGYTVEALVFLLSFSGWAFISIITLGLGLTVAIPRFTVAAIYYSWLRKDIYQVIETVEPIEKKAALNPDGIDARPTLA